MKTTLAAIFALLIAAQTLFPQQDFRISDNRLPSTYEQRSPYLFSAGERGFIVAWEDFRLGEMQYFAQRFDKFGSRVGSNFKTDNNNHIILGNNNDYLVIKEGTSTYFILELFTDHYAYTNIYDKDNNRLSSHDLGRVTFGPVIDKVISHDAFYKNGYYYVVSTLNDSVYRFGSDGTLISGFHNGYPIIGPVTVAATEDNHYASIYVMAKDFFSSAGVYARFFDDADSMIADPVLIQGYDEYIGPFDTPSLEAHTFSDSLYRFFIIEPFSTMVKTVMYTQLGEIHSDMESFELIDVPGTDPNSSYISVEDIAAVEQTDGTFSLYISYRYHVSNTTGSNLAIFTFSPDGTFIERTNGDDQIDPVFLRGAHHRGDAEYFVPGMSNSDIYLYTLDNGMIVDSLKINDDEEGSNQTEPAVKKMNDMNFYVTWKEERGYYGRQVGINGEVVGESRNLEGKSLIFSEDGNRFVLWNTKTSDEVYIFGYSLYDASWSTILVDTLATDAQHSRVDGKGYSLGDNRQLILYRNGGILHARIINSAGELLIERSIAEIASSGYRAIPHEDGIFIIWGNFGRVYDADLEIAGDTVTLRRQINLYLGEDIYLHAFLGYPRSATGIVMNFKGDTLVPAFRISSDTSELKLTRLDKDHFLAVYRTITNKIYGKVYHNSGVMLADSFLVYRETDGIKQNPDILVIDNHLLAVWSDNRSADRGYDIYGRVFKVADLTTSVPEPIAGNIPDEYRLFQNYPNPFNPATTIEYSIPQSARVKLSVYDLLGREIAVLVDEYQNTGRYRVDFDASGLSSGIYIYRLRAGGYSLVKRMSLIK